MKNLLLCMLLIHISLYAFSQDENSTEEEKDKKEIVKPLDLYLFSGTNIDPLGEKKVTSASFELIKRLNFSKKWQGRFGLYTNKNSIADSTSFRTLYFSPDVKKGLKEGESTIYTQTYDLAVARNIRAWGGYFNLIGDFRKKDKIDEDDSDDEENPNQKNAWIKPFISLEFTYREQTGSPQIKNSVISDSVIYSKDFPKNITIGSLPITTDRTIIPARQLYQTFFSAGVIFESFTTNCEFYLQASAGVASIFERIRNPSVVRELDSKCEGFVALKGYIRTVPSNIIIAGDLKSFGKGNMFLNLSIGLPLDIAALVKK